MAPLARSTMLRAVVERTAGVEGAKAAAEATRRAETKVFIVTEGRKRVLQRKNVWSEAEKDVNHSQKNPAAIFSS